MSLCACSSDGKVLIATSRVTTAAGPCGSLCLAPPRGEAPWVVVALACGATGAAQQPKAERLLAHRLDLDRLQEVGPSLLGGEQPTASLLEGSHRGLRWQALRALVAFQLALGHCAAAAGCLALVMDMGN